MAAPKRQITLNLDADTYQCLAALSVKNKQKVAALSVSLIQKALSLEEDLYFSTVADKRMAQKQKYISHDVAWSKYTK